MTARPSYWELLADKIAAHPETLATALDTIAHWRAIGQTAPHRLAQWEELLRSAQTGRAGLKRLLSVLRGTDETSERLRDFNPFAGILTREERRQTRELCGYRH